ncbi:hypothetical protein K458DRAFT_423605 [Lentithecium fluviatile CBS 122367]|uniref:Uncharacterized protein n=1 Tax=Lentithecium fluviatile CBS 122367 TaxID=1168545 RepID=A0A6G1IIZ6_9PLEO|nr:hypothetical protein K458DRAFT_423605 [Lentithecium fluviatile CBS 122367]
MSSSTSPTDDCTNEKKQPSSSPASSYSRLSSFSTLSSPPPQIYFNRKLSTHPRSTTASTTHSPISPGTPDNTSIQPFLNNALPHHGRGDRIRTCGDEGGGEYGRYMDGAKESDDRFGELCGYAGK